MRKFTDEKIKREDLELLVKCGLHAPSARRSDKWHFTVLNNSDLIAELINTISGLLENQSYNMYNPSAVIIISTEADYHFGVDDNACALENIFLAANSLGIGSVWINQLRDFNDNEKLREFYNKLEIPNNHVVYGIAALGYPDGDPAKIERGGSYKFFD